MLSHWSNIHRHIILIPSQTASAVMPLYYVLSREATNPIFIAFGLTWTMHQSTTHQTRGTHISHYITDVTIFIDFKEIM